MSDTISPTTLADQFQDYDPNLSAIQAYNMACMALDQVGKWLTSTADDLAEQAIETTDATWSGKYSFADQTVRNEAGRYMNESR